MHLKNSALSFLFLLLTGWGFFSYAGTVQVLVPRPVILNSAQSVANVVNALSHDAIAFQNVSSTVAQVEANLNRLKGARYIIQPVLASRGNLYILGASLIGSALFDYLINYLESQKNQYLSSIPPSSCQSFQISCYSYHTEHICGSQCSYISAVWVTQWVDGGSHNCFYRWDQKDVYLGKNDCIDVAVTDGTTFQCSSNINYFLPGKGPVDYVDCSSGQPKPRSNYPPFILPPISDGDVASHIPSSDFTSTITFPDSPNIKIPQDISPPLVSSDGSVIYDIPNYSPDGVFSPDYTNPSNYVPDIPLNDPSVKITYSITDPTTNQTHNYMDMNSQPSTSPNNNNADYTYNPTDKDLDTKIDVPEKKDLKTLITSNIDAIKNRFSFDSGCSGGVCSFSVDVFGHSATIDFCQFADLFSTIGTVILVFSYFYAFFIITRGN